MSYLSGGGLGLTTFIRENHQSAQSWVAALGRGCHRLTGRSATPTCGKVRGDEMAAMKPRTGDGPLEVTKEGRGIVMRVPLEGGGRLVVELSAAEAGDLADALKNAAG